MSQCIRSPLIHTSVHECTHTHTCLQLQTTSKENAGVQKNVVSLITRNRITVCKCVYMYLLHSEIWLSTFVHFLLPPFTHTHTHYMHLSSKSWVSTAKGSAQKLSLEVSVPFVTVRLRKSGGGRGGAACSACVVH